MIGVVDVFAGCGGLSEGFSQLKRSCTFPFDVRLHIEKENAPIRTLELRTFYHLFREKGVPEIYYDYVTGRANREELFRNCPTEAAEATRRRLQVELGSSDTDAEVVNRRIADAVNRADAWVLLGGPPCQAYSIIGRSRNRGKANYDINSDHRTLLYKEYLNILSYHKPTAFVMENVRGLLSASHRNKSMFQQMVQDLKSPGYQLYYLSNGKQYFDDGYNPYDPTDL